jgi:MFS family permease
MVKGIQGIAQLAFSLPAGLLADRIRRDAVLRFSGALGLVCAALTLLAVELNNLTIIYVAFGLWGVFSAFQSPAMEALFADSIPHGRRSFPLTLKYNVSNVAMVIGPFLSILLFLYVGDVWRVRELRPVLVFGCVLAAISSLFLFRYDDDLALKEDEATTPLASRVDPVSPFQIHRQQHRPSVDSLGTPLRTPTYVGGDLQFEYDYSDIEEEGEGDDDAFEMKEYQRLEAAPRVNQVANSATSEHSALITVEPAAELDHEGHSSDDDAEMAVTPMKRPTTIHKGDTAGVHDSDVRFLGMTTEHVPYLLFLSDFIISNGAGMTINFFPLFFMAEYGLSPIQVCALFLVQPIVVLVLSFLCQRVSKTIGRTPIIVSTRIASTVCLVGMAFAQPLHLQVLLFLMRGGMMRCSQPLRRSVLMDFVKREVRARWNALEGISVFSYSGSAVVGGYLVDQYDYRTCFFITSLVYFAGLSLELLLLPLTKHAVEK